MDKQVRLFHRVFDALVLFGAEEGDRRGSFTDYMAQTPPWSRASLPVRGLLGCDATFCRNSVQGVYVKVADSQESPSVRERLLQLNMSLRPLYQEWLQLLQE